MIEIFKELLERLAEPLTHKYADIMIWRGHCAHEIKESIKAGTFERTAREWTLIHATPDRSGLADAIEGNFEVHCDCMVMLVACRGPSGDLRSTPPSTVQLTVSFCL